MYGELDAHVPLLITGETAMMIAMSFGHWEYVERLKGYCSE